MNAPLGRWLTYREKSWRQFIYIYIYRSANEFQCDILGFYLTEFYSTCVLDFEVLFNVLVLSRVRFFFITIYSFLFLFFRINKYIFWVFMCVYILCTSGCFFLFSFFLFELNVYENELVQYSPGHCFSLSFFSLYLWVESVIDIF